MEDNKRVTSFKERHTKDGIIWSLFHSWIKWTRMDNKTFSVHYLKEMTTPAEKKTLFYKLFSMSKREWDIEVKLHQQKLNRKQREYMLTFRQHSKENK